MIRDGTGPNDGYNMMDAQRRTSQRIRRWGIVFALALVALCSWTHALAQEVTCSLWIINGPGADNVERDFGEPAGFCAAALADATPGATLDVCDTGLESAYYVIAFGGSTYNYSAERTCTTEEPESPASAASSPNVTPEGLTTAEALEALMWGSLLLFAFLGYRQGYSV